MEHAQEVILLADSSKAGKLSFARFGSLERVNALITDKSLGRAAARDFAKRKIKVIMV